MHCGDYVSSSSYGTGPITAVGVLMTGISGGTLVTIIDAILTAQGEPTLKESVEEAFPSTRTKKSRSKPKRKASPAQKRYGRAFRRLAPKYKKKNGQWKKDGFKRCVRAAHRDCRRKMR